MLNKHSVIKQKGRDEKYLEHCFFCSTTAHWQMSASRGSGNQTLKQCDSSASLAFSNHHQQPMLWDVYIADWIGSLSFICVCYCMNEDPNQIHSGKLYVLNIAHILKYLSSPFFTHTGDFIFALQDGWATMSVVGTEADGVTVTTDLPVKCSWALRDPGSHGSQ